MASETVQAASDAAASGWSGWTIFAILGLLLLSGFFSGSETALTAVSRARLRRAADQGSVAAKRAIALTEDGETLIGAILIGNNLVNILATSLATSLALAVFGDSGVAVATLVMTILVMVFAEVLPKTYAYTFSERASLVASRPIGVLVRLLHPVVLAVRFVVRFVLRVFGVRLEQGAHMLSHEAHEEIRGAIDLHHYESGHVEKSDRDRLVGALDLGNREVSEVMMHRRNIKMLNADSPPQELIEAVLESPYTRIPLWRDEPENIVGVIHAKDLLRAVDKMIRRQGGGLQGVDTLDIVKIAMEPWFVPDTTSLADQLREFLTKRSHFALVVDEYGVLQGLITLEDILEEIVGDIADEHDIEAAGVKREADGAFLVDGTVTIRDLNRLFDWTLPDDEATTVAGLVIHEAQAIPSEGQSFVFHDFRFDIVKRMRNQITLLRMRPVRRM